MMVLSVHLTIITAENTTILSLQFLSQTYQAASGFQRVEHRLLHRGSVKYVRLIYTYLFPKKNFSQYMLFCTK